MSLLDGHEWTRWVAVVVSLALLAGPYWKQRRRDALIAAVCLIFLVTIAGAWSMSSPLFSIRVGG